MKKYKNYLTAYVMINTIPWL